MTSLELDYVVFLGDPEDGAAALPSAKLNTEFSKHSASLKIDSLYGAMTFTRGGKELAPRKADPILPLITNVVRAVRYVIDGEPETALFTESECGLLFEPSGDDVYISFFLGDPGEPEKVLMAQTAIKVGKFGEQVVAMGDRLAELLKKIDPDFLENDDHGKSLRDFLKEGKESFRTFQLEVERGIRV
jgi:hypothetical protein